MQNTKAITIDDYIAGFPDDVRQRLQLVRDTIKQIAPDATETIKYAMPAFVLNGDLVYFAGFKNHIGFYPTPSGVEEFEQDLAQYKTGKGSIQFPLDRPLPLDLIERMTKFRMQKNLNTIKNKR